ncbi:MAG: Cu(I)-responsive transcriptional regulator [Alphaproteobacteria bacterium]|nr:Cu(I)-responsive transcriptional regulator [Alphaproteobacteria bacterium]
MNIGAAAERSGMPPKTIRYYESVGLIQPAERRGNGYRDYSDKDVATLRFVHRARGLGFTIEECRELLALYRDRERASGEVKKIALDRVATIDRKIAELQGMRSTLMMLAHRCHGDDRPDCPILEDLAAVAVGR